MRSETLKRAHEMASNEMLEEIPEEEEKSSTSVELTPYEKLLNAVHDQKLVHDIALEKRVGLYRFLGDIGRGNFSRVKKAVHLLTKGNSFFDAQFKKDIKILIKKLYFR